MIYSGNGLGRRRVKIVPRIQVRIMILKGIRNLVGWGRNPAVLEKKELHKAYRVVAQRDGRNAGFFLLLLFLQYFHQIALPVAMHFGFVFVDTK